MPDVIVVPPIRTPLLTLNGAPLTGLDAANGDKSAGGPPAGRTSIDTSRDWWMYWRTLAEFANAGVQMLTFGAHGDRPDAAGMPDGAIYVESDHSGVIYQNQGGEWHYLAGTMYGTLSPDQRPTDLGVNDAGFDFRTIDTDPLLGAREFIWSGSVWVEATPVLYGTHAGRPTGANAPPRCLYVETDRSEVLYQNQNTVWHFIAGTMWGTLSPDQRPTDLGVNDAGFTFRGTDQARAFIWSGTAWVETTPVTGAGNLTHPNVVTKVGTTGQVVEGGITDLSTANSDKVHITAAGDVGIGLAAPATRVDIKGGAGVLQIRNTDTSNNNCQFRIFGANANTALWAFGTDIAAGNGSQDLHIWNLPVGGAPFTIRSSGLVGINITAPTFQLQVGLDSAAKPSTSTWSVASDIRLKQNIEPVKDDSLAILAGLDWIRYEYNGQADMPRGLKAIGLEAHALRERLPEAVRSTKAKLKETDADEMDVLAIDYHHILVHSARAIQQLDAEVKALRALIGKPLP